MALLDVEHIEKNSTILVTVEEFVADIIVVSFCYKGDIFQGVLLNSRNKLLPCGILPPSQVAPPLGNAAQPPEDKLYSVSQRYSYFQEKVVAKPIDRRPVKVKAARMTVRLRPRQVLCSKCRGICNENSENVDVSSKKKSDVEADGQKPSRPDRRLRSSVDNALPLEEPKTQTKKRNNQNNVPYNGKKKKVETTVPTLPVCSNLNVNGHVKKKKLYDRKNENHPPDTLSDDIDETDNMEKDPLSLTGQDEAEDEEPRAQPIDPIQASTIDYFDAAAVDPLDVSQPNESRAGKRKRSAESIGDYEDPSQPADRKLNKTPIIKISYGEGSVLKIAAKPQHIPSECEAGEKTKRDASSKAAKKALKRAKKEARRKILEVSSPVRSMGGTSPRYSSLSPRYVPAILSPRQNIGNGSPPQVAMHKKHKHKVKHKKRHKEDKKHRDCIDSDVKEGQLKDCLKQKLSINLKRLNANAYMRCESSSPTASDCSDEPSDAVPDFPNNSAMTRVFNDTINSCQTNDGRRMTVGDVVWGKIHGFPWWPGKVVRIAGNAGREEVDSVSPQAHVSWYGSSTSSVMSCDHLNPFLETFQIRYNKKKRGPYREAIKQATSEARQGANDGIPVAPSQVDILI